MLLFDVIIQHQCSHLAVSLSPHQMWSLHVVVSRLCDLHAGIGMTINLQGHPMSVIQHSLAMNHCTYLFESSIHLFICIVFKHLKVMLMFRPPLFLIVRVRFFWSAKSCKRAEVLGLNTKMLA